MKTSAYVLGVFFVIVAVIYYLVPGGSLPSFMPGFIEGSTRIHKLHGFGALSVAVLFFLIGLSTKR
jgi:hypothetical protein